MVMDKAKKLFNKPKPKVRTYTSLNPGVTTPRRNIVSPTFQQLREYKKQTMPLYASLTNPLSEGDALYDRLSNEDIVEDGDFSVILRRLELSPSHLGKALKFENEKYCPKGHKMRD